MLTIATVMDSQKPETKLRLYFAVVDGFSVEKMLKILTLREKIREDIDFNFYKEKRVETDFNYNNFKGNAICGKLILPILLTDDVEKKIILDTGDTMVLRDLPVVNNLGYRK